MYGQRFAVLVGEDVTLCTFADSRSAVIYALGLQGLLTGEAYRSITIWDMVDGSQVSFWEVVR